MKCQTCQEDFQPKYKANVYCSRACAARSNNRKYPKRTRVPNPPCATCGIELGQKKKKGTYCASCRAPSLRAIYIQQWLDGKISGGVGKAEAWLSTTIRTFLLEKARLQCERCGFDTPHPQDGQSILEINHINGDGTDHRPGNLEVICPNCHALTASYRGRNAGHGRPVSYLRIDKDPKEAEVGIEPFETSSTL